MTTILGHQDFCTEACRKDTKLERKLGHKEIPGRNYREIAPESKCQSFSKVPGTDPAAGPQHPWGRETVLTLGAQRVRAQYGTRVVGVGGRAHYSRGRCFLCCPRTWFLYEWRISAERNTTGGKNKVPLAYHFFLSSHSPYISGLSPDHGAGCSTPDQ